MSGITEEDTFSYLYLNDYGFLAIGSGFVIDELETVTLQEIVRKVKHGSIQELQNPSPNLCRKG